MFKNYIFDFGNVIANFDPVKLAEPYVYDECMLDDVVKVAFDRLYWDRLDAGTITDDEIKADMKKRLNDKAYEMACRAYENWVNTMTPVAGMHKLINDIKKENKKLYLISNISEGFAREYKNVPWINEVLSQFDGLVFSATTGKSKPNRDIFEHLLNTYSLKAKECIFIDDSAKNLDGAKLVGIEGYLFDGSADKLRKFLKI